MTAPAFVPLAVRPHLRPEPWAPWTSIGCDSDALLIDRRDPARLTAREVSPEIAAAVYWEGEA